MASNYERGRAFEYRTRDALLRRGAVYVMRAAQSKGKVDLLALFPEERIPLDIQPPNSYIEEWLRTPSIWIVQCKRDGRLPAAEAAELIRIATETGALPILAKAGKNGRGVEFINLLNEGAA